MKAHCRSKSRIAVGTGAGEGAITAGIAGRHNGWYGRPQHYGQRYYGGQSYYGRGRASISSSEAAHAHITATTADGSLSQMRSAARRLPKQNQSKEKKLSEYEKRGALRLFFVR